MANDLRARIIWDNETGSFKKVQVEVDALTKRMKSLDVINGEVSRTIGKVVGGAKRLQGQVSGLTDAFRSLNTVSAGGTAAYVVGTAKMRAAAKDTHSAIIGFQKNETTNFGNELKKRTSSEEQQRKYLLGLRQRYFAERDKQEEKATRQSIAEQRKREREEERGNAKKLADQKRLEKAEQDLEIRRRHQIKTRWDLELEASRKTTNQLVKDVERIEKLRDQARAKAFNATNAFDIKDASRASAAYGMEASMLRKIIQQRPDAKFAGAGSTIGIMGLARTLVPGIGTSQLFNAFEGITKSSNGVNASLGAGVAKWGLWGATAAAALGGLKYLVGKGSVLEQADANLRALTGLSRQQSAELTKDGMALSAVFGVELPQSLGAFKLIISALGPEIAKNRQALVSMTRDAMLLSKASGDDLTNSVQAITTMLAQFGFTSKSVEEQVAATTRIVHALAAMSKEGAAEVPAITEAIKEVGTVARQAQMSIEQTGAAIEVLAMRGGIQRGEAGTGLRNLITFLSSGTKEAEEALKKLGLTFYDINPELVGFETSLSTLKTAFEKIKDPVEQDAIKLDLFRRENLKFANILIDNNDLLGELEGKVTGTSQATVMANINQETLNDTLERFSVRISNAATGLGSTLIPATRSWASVLTKELGAALEGVLLLMQDTFTMQEDLDKLYNKDKKAPVQPTEDMKYRNVLESNAAFDSSTLGSFSRFNSWVRQGQVLDIQIQGELDLGMSHEEIAKKRGVALEYVKKFKRKKPLGKEEAGKAQKQALDRDRSQSESTLLGQNRTINRLEMAGLLNRNIAERVREEAQLQAMERERDILRKHGESTVQIESQIEDKKLQLYHKRIDERKRLTEQEKRDEEERQRELERLAKEEYDKGSKQLQINAEKRIGDLQVEHLTKRTSAEDYEQRVYDVRRKALEDQITLARGKGQELEDLYLRLQKLDNDFKVSVIQRGRERAQEELKAIENLASPFTNAFLEAAQTIKSGFFDFIDRELSYSKNAFGGFFGSIIKGIVGLATELAAKSAVFGILKMFAGDGITATLGQFLGLSPEKKARGGRISGPGTETSDSIPALLSDGEYVVNAKSTSRYLPLLHAINSGGLPGFRTGGPVMIDEEGGLMPSTAEEARRLEEWKKRVAEREREKARYYARIRRQMEREARRETRSKENNASYLGDYSWLERGAEATAGFLYGSLAGPVESAVNLASLPSDAFFGTHIGQSVTDYNQRNIASLGSAGRAGFGVGSFTGNVGMAGVGSQAVLARLGGHGASKLAQYNTALGMKNALSAGDFSHYLGEGDAAGATNTALWNALLAFGPYKSEGMLGELGAETIGIASSKIASATGAKSATKGGLKQGAGALASLFNLDALRSDAQEARGVVEKEFYTPVEEGAEKGGKKNTEMANKMVSGITNVAKAAKTGDAGKTFFAVASAGLSFIPGFGPLAAGIFGSLGDLFGLKDGGPVRRYGLGGSVVGQGGPKDDRIPALLSNGEYVFPASAVNRAGGFSGMRAIHSALENSMPLPIAQPLNTTVVNQTFVQDNAETNALLREVIRVAGQTKIGFPIRDLMDEMKYTEGRRA